MSSEQACGADVLPAGSHFSSHGWKREVFKMEGFDNQ
jgi:hypothetical protein